jgi:hypothetical protein
MLDTATAFFLAGERCALDCAIGRYPAHTLGAPTVTNYALSLEIALKLLCHLSGKSFRQIHDLSALFDLLPSDQKAHLQYTEGCVVEISRYFVEWRYVYERDFAIAIESLPRRCFVECYQEIRRIRPDLKSVYEMNWGQFDPEWLVSSADQASPHE